ncbi:unnamed protein product, partial [Closterium sp. NIES-64]
CLFFWKAEPRDQAFTIGNEIVAAVTALSPAPVALKLEKVYHPCVLQTKKRYVGLAYESPAATCPPVFDAKGIETVRRDGCPAVSKLLEKSLKILFSTNDLSRARSYLVRQWQRMLQSRVSPQDFIFAQDWQRMLQGRVSLQDFIFAQEVGLGTYSTNPRCPPPFSSLPFSLLSSIPAPTLARSSPPAAIVATKAMQRDSRAEPKYKERVQYVIVCGDPGSRLVDLVVEPRVAVDSQCLRLNVGYYITRKVIPALHRVFALVGTRVASWFAELPLSQRVGLGKQPLLTGEEAVEMGEVGEEGEGKQQGMRVGEEGEGKQQGMRVGEGLEAAGLAAPGERQGVEHRMQMGALQCQSAAHVEGSGLIRVMLWELVSLKRVLAESSPGALSAYSDTGDPCSGAWGDRGNMQRGGVQWSVQGAVERAGCSGACRVQWSVQGAVERAGCSGACRVQWSVQGAVERAGCSGACRVQWSVQGAVERAGCSGACRVQWSVQGAVERAGCSAVERAGCSGACRVQWSVQGAVERAGCSAVERAGCSGACRVQWSVQGAVERAGCSGACRVQWSVQGAVERAGCSGACRVQWSVQGAVERAGCSGARRVQWSAQGAVERAGCSGSVRRQGSCYESGQIITLNFTAEGLTGALPGKELSRFRTLQSLSLAFNNLTGKVPSWLGLSFLNLVEL